MARKETNIYKRKDECWEARYVKEIGLDGKRRYGSVYGASYTEAQQKRLVIMQNTRFPSPVFFKIINNVVYFVGMPIDDFIYGKTFVFSAKFRGNVSVKVPQKDELPKDFINEFMEYAFKRLTEFIKYRTKERAFEILEGVNLIKVV